ncbi:F0F1 ATP synthase subunit gamma [Bradyrhizobium sp. dw_78]|uniref:F0F1 ATP synthase subunit gamma n=1 Tax=Bradyrhizobium sp. dw_78 TaxID=2719793 RepID=UPI001BD5C583|nr:F0F1 ATP synthase subunit gamma [Bradyrhizobium sp. dw_78]
MTERLADIRARIGGVRQLDAVVNAMRSMAAARVQQARGQLVAVDGFAATVAAAIGRSLALVPSAREPAGEGSGRLGIVVFCAEQGFAGAFSERVLNAIGNDAGSSDLFLVGTRGRAVAAERNLAVGWNDAMPPNSLGIPKLADRIASAVYDRVAAHEVTRLDTMFTRWQPGRGFAVERINLFPLDRKAFATAVAADAPLVNLEPDALLGALTADYIYARLCHAALHAFAAENEARMEAMASARSHIERQLTALQAREQLVRQDEITAEIIELAAGESASRR